MAEVTPIRPDVKPDKPKRKSRDRDASLKKRLHKVQFRLGRAVALTRALAAAFEDEFVRVHGTEEIDAMDGMLGLADLLDGIRAEMCGLYQSKTVAGG
jgi:hypothetical protein